jgi:methionyl-tRNA formyltransferase
LTLRALELLADPSFSGTPQDERRVTLCKKVQKHDGEVDWSRGADDVYNRFRAFEPWPGTFTFHQGRRIAIVGMRADDSGVTALAPGEAVLDKKRHCLTVGTGAGAVGLVKLKPAGGKEQQAEAFWNGLKDRTKVVFGGAGA